MRRLVVLAMVSTWAVPAAAQQSVEPPIPALLEPTYLLSTARIVDPDRHRGEGRILGTTRETAIRDQSLTASDHVFVPQQLDGRPVVPGDLVQLYRLGRQIQDPRTEERLGRLLVPTGIASVDSLAGEVVRARITHAFLPVVVGDFARAVTEADTLPGMAPGATAAEGYVVALQEEKAIVPSFDRIFVRTSDPFALAPGQVVLVYRPGPVVAGRRLPDVPIARAMVVRADGEIAAVVLYEVFRSDLVPGDLFRGVSAAP